MRCSGRVPPRPRPAPVEDRRPRGGRRTKWYANRAASTAAVIGVLARYMDWADRTSRPTHARIAQMAKLSPRTVTRAIAWLEEQGIGERKVN